METEEQNLESETALQLSCKNVKLEYQVDVKGGALLWKSVNGSE